MPVYLVVLYISALVWIFPAIRQFKSDFFYYFLFIALCDPFGLLNVYFLHIIDPNKSLTIVSLLMFYASQYGERINLSKWILNIILALIYIYVLLYFEKQDIPNAILHLFILYKFMKAALLNLHSEGELNFFYFVLVFYEISLIFSKIVHFSGTDAAIIVFISTISFQILIAIFFIIFREDSPALIFKIKPAK